MRCLLLCRPEGSDEEARALLPFGAAVGDGGMGAVLSQAVFARERGTVRR